MYAIEDPAFLLAPLILLVLSIATIEYCRRDTVTFSDDAERLFLGDQKIHSFASNIGSLFSVTYFFGAAVIYGGLFGTWLLLVVVLVLLTVRPLILLLLAKTPSSTSEAVSCSNLLLDLFKANLESDDFKIITKLYLLIYFGLLIEELAVARLLLTSLFPSMPALVALILTIISFCVVLYLYVGGFRAVLKSDLIQLLILSPFLLSMVFLMARTPSLDEAIDFSLAIDSGTAFTALAFSYLFGVAWFVSSVDLFARFNFTPHTGRSLGEERSQLLDATLLGVAVFLAVGMAFGSHLRGELPAIDTPVGYFESATYYFVHSDSQLIAVVALLSLYSMIFTTLDALMLNLLQVGWYQPKPRWNRGQLLKILAVAAFISCLLDLNSLGSIGIFLGSLLILPAFGLLVIFIFKGRFHLPTKLTFLIPSGVIATLIFFVFFDYFRLPFERQLLLSGVVFGSVVICLLSFTVGRAVRSAWHKCHR